MARINHPASRIHQAIANIANHLEDNLSPELFDFMDGGLTLEICPGALNEIKQDSTWQRLEADFVQVGGCVSLAKEWEVA